MSIFNKNNKKKIALAVACASVLGGKSSLAAQNTGKVGGAVVSSKKMGKLTKGLIIGGSVLGAAELINEGLGIFTNADAWYKGKFSVANGVKHLLATTPEERKILTQKILDVIYSFPNLAKIHSSEEYKAELNKGANNNSNDEFLNLEILKNIPQGKNLNLDEVLPRVEIEFSEYNNKLHFIEKAQAAAQFMYILTDKEKMNEWLEKKKVRMGYTANGFTLKGPENSEEVKYNVNSIIIDSLEEKEEAKKGKIKLNKKISFIMNNDGSLTLEGKIEEYSNGKLTYNEHSKFTLKPANKGIAKEV